jgi:hypothetical protein
MFLLKIIIMLNGVCRHSLSSALMTGPNHWCMPLKLYQSLAQQVVQVNEAGEAPIF